MTQLDDLKDAMHSPPDFRPAPLDLQHVMAAGGSIRRRRRLAVGGASALAVVALLVGGSQLVNLGVPLRQVPVAGPSALPSTGNSSAPGVVGTIVETGQKADGRRWILYTETSDPNRLERSLTLILGTTVKGTFDDFRPEIVSTDPPGADRLSPGFHAVRAGRLLGDRTTPTFGYYVGDAAKITARDTGTGATVAAKRAPWTAFDEESNTQIFWFDFPPGSPPATLTDITAYDAKGAKLHAAD
ncbi:hypothetical protein [Actinoplanes couchii]|uniref:Uncharacterized protein n=1 Tax=Actinoplanes couchii TaxID=403638 RepID=A0ABQ3X876_9ACTN|nr:hypothetical protein [Actinoplanes couchii]MDR6320284.1 hypothetical protein [Actinoplanes couchii]GID54701.1 hypothetical protein Aco03nite_031050 [Actinoplanes couchii]